MTFHIVTYASFLILLSSSCFGAGTISQYVVGPLDVLSISVYDHSELQKDVTVTPDGKISFPLVEELTVAGLTVGQIQQRIAAALSEGYIVNPQVTVSVKELHSQRYFVFGEVSNPGAFTWTGSVSLLEALALAGGFKKESPPDNVSIFRETAGRYETQEVQLGPLLRGEATPDRGVTILPNDVLLVPKSETKQVFVYGEVEHPGAYTYEPKMTALQAVTLAGGPNKFGSMKKVKVLRSVEDRYEIQYLNLKRCLEMGDKSQDMALSPGDIITVSRSLF